jgi:hypothetical protein
VPKTLPTRVRLSLAAVHVVAFATLLRSVLYERWITVVASLLLIAGAAAAQRGRTWGVGVALGAAVAFPAAFAIGIAPAWFCLVGLIGALPFILTSRAIARFDAAAAAVGATLAAAAGVACAVAYRAIAPTLFESFPALRPSWHAENVGVVAAIVALAAVAAALRPRAARVRVAAPGVRVAAGAGGEEASRAPRAPEESADEAVEDPPRARLKRW